MPRLPPSVTRFFPRMIDDPVFWLRVALLFVTEFAFCRGWRYTIEREPIPMALTLISDGFSIAVYGSAWFLAALFALISIPKAWPGGSAMTIILSLVFAFAFTLSWISAWGHPIGFPGRADYTNASTYWLSVGLLMCGYFLSRKALRSEDGRA